MWGFYPSCCPSWVDSPELDGLMVSPHIKQLPVFHCRVLESCPDLVLLNSHWPASFSILLLPLCLPFLQSPTDDGIRRLRRHLCDYSKAPELSWTWVNTSLIYIACNYCFITAGVLSVIRWLLYNLNTRWFLFNNNRLRSYSASHPQRGSPQYFANLTIKGAEK